MDRAEKLKQLEGVLKSAIDECETDKLAALAKQYRETLREIVTPISMNCLFSP